jgi:hypothetical protein
MKCLQWLEFSCIIFTLEGFVMRNDFQLDERIGQSAASYAQKAVEFARDRLGIVLDWSDESVVLVEDILSRLHQGLEKANPSEGEIIQYAKTFGSYVGEVFRKNHGALWGIITLQGRRIFGLQTPDSQMLLWPWLLAQNRIMNGPQDNINYSYRMVISGRPIPLVEKSPYPEIQPPRQWRDRFQDLAIRCRQLITH